MSEFQPQRHLSNKSKLISVAIVLLIFDSFFGFKVLFNIFILIYIYILYLHIVSTSLSLYNAYI